MYVVMLKNKKSIALTTESLRLPNWELRIFIIVEEFEDTTVAIVCISQHSSIGFKVLSTNRRNSDKNRYLIS